MFEYRTNGTLNQNTIHAGFWNPDPEGSLFHEFSGGTGPTNSVFLDNHPMTEDLKNVFEVDRLRYNMYNKYNGSPQVGDSYTEFDSDFGIPGAIKAGDNGTYQFVGTFSSDVFVSDDGQSLIFVISDSKSLQSLLYRLGGVSHERTEAASYGNTYQKYIWSEPIDSTWYSGQKGTRDANGRVLPAKPAYDRLFKPIE